MPLGGLRGLGRLVEGDRFLRLEFGLRGPGFGGVLAAFSYFVD